MRVMHGVSGFVLHLMCLCVGLCALFMRPMVGFFMREVFCTVL
ncbi:hypothetical protein [Helicobacter heilmannii]|nr:hypothetical protein [Helicobacter heilmannii]